MAHRLHLLKVEKEQGTGNESRWRQMSRENDVKKSPGLIKASTAGIIRHDIDNLGRRLISVEWHVGIVDYMFPSEIEILENTNLLS